jgi:hypothetical protein
MSELTYDLCALDVAASAPGVKQIIISMSTTEPMESEIEPHCPVIKDIVKLI